jgi:hypothetical protein
MSVQGNRELGSIVTFFIVGIILVAATVGTVFVVVRRGEQVRKDQATATSNQLAAENKQNAQNAANAAKAAAASVAATSSAATTKPQADTVATSTALPTTGTELDVARIVAIGLLVGTTTSFVLSRRGLKRPL